MMLPTRLALVAIVVAIAATAAVTTTTAAAISAVTATTAATVSSWLGFVDSEISSTKVLAIECLDSCCRLFGGRHFHKSKPA